MTLQILGTCANSINKCKEALDVDYEIWTDENDNKFCSKECAVKFNGIRELSNEEIGDISYGMIEAQKQMWESEAV